MTAEFTSTIIRTFTADEVRELSTKPRKRFKRADYSGAMNAASILCAKHRKEFYVSPTAYGFDVSHEQPLKTHGYSEFRIDSAGDMIVTDNRYTYA